METAAPHEIARQAVEDIADRVYARKITETIRSGESSPTVPEFLAAIDAEMDVLRRDPDSVPGCGERFEADDVREAIGWVQGNTNSLREEHRRREEHRVPPTTTRDLDGDGDLPPDDDDDVPPWERASASPPAKPPARPAAGPPRPRPRPRK